MRIQMPQQAHLHLNAAEIATVTMHWGYLALQQQIHTAWEMIHWHTVTLTACISECIVLIPVLQVNGATT